MQDEFSGDFGIAAVNDTVYLYNQKMTLIFGSLQVLILTATIFVSVFKPWKSKKARRKILQK